VQHLGELNSIRLEPVRFFDSIGFVSLKTRRITISILNFISVPAMKVLQVPTVPLRKKKRSEAKMFG